jgi:hypothetical protein
MFMRLYCSNKRWEARAGNRLLFWELSKSLWRGGSFNIIKSDDAARTSKGKTKIYNEVADSGNSLERHFCGDCGSPIYSVTTAYPGIKIWKAGLFSDAQGLEVVTNIWCDSAPSWGTMDNTIPSHGKSRQW